MGRGDFRMLQSGIKKIAALIYTGKYRIEQATIDPARAAYIATVIEKGGTEITRYNEDPRSAIERELAPTVSNKLNKLKKILPEAYFYWVEISRLL